MERTRHPGRRFAARSLALLLGGATLGCALAAWRAGLVGPAEATAPAATRTATSAPAGASAPVEDAVSSALAAACEQAARRLRGRLGEGYEVVSAPPFVVAGDVPLERLEGYLEASIRRPAEAMWRCYFDRRPDRVITVLLLADDASYRREARRLFGDTDVSRFGYYRRNERTLVMNIATGSGTLVHELTHALIACDWPGVPAWFNEGLASLHEQCHVGEDRIIGLPNWRLPALQEAIRRGRLGSLADLPDADFYGPDRGLNYAHARYFCLYLQDRGLLESFYHRYRAAHAEGASPVAVIEDVTGRPIDRLDEELRAFVLGLRFEP